MMKRRIEITLEFEREMVIRKRPVELGWCSECRICVAVLLVREAASSMNIDVTEIHEQFVNGVLHRVLDQGGNEMVCRESLFAWRTSAAVDR